ncbi:MAG: RpiB/LacA/LacB family sugar-phosphate isomerase [Candidatus Liptonbacteria bacterium]|nr:RpiB/LacA/LacB family sugar-phosphate isomerase [Candidatus Liptonbacteria bacterium]
MLYIGADHRGFALKEELKKHLVKTGYEFQDLGAFQFDKEDDYVDFAQAVAEKVSADPENNNGILICGSGHGMDMVANKYKGVRAALGFNEKVAVQSREHENSNVLVIASDWVDQEMASVIAVSWLKTKFSGEERHLRRLQKIKELEK